jgi:hypothetical protein
MKIKVWFVVAAIFVTTGTALSAEIQVDYTNQFFVSKIEEGYCYVFLYPDNSRITFVKYSEKNKTAEKIDITVGSINTISNIFIIKNEFFMMLAGNEFNIYNLSELVKSENNNSRLGTRGRIAQLKCDSFSLYEDKFFFTKDKNPQVYEYTGKGQSVLAGNIKIESASGYNLFQFNPVSTLREKRYTELLSDLEKDAGDLMKKKADIKLDEQKMPPRVSNGYPLAADDIYTAMKENISKSAVLDSGKYADIFKLAAITGKGDADITSKIKSLNTGISQPSAAVISAYYTQVGEIDDLTNGEKTVAKREAAIEETIRTLNTNMTVKYNIKKIEDIEKNYKNYNEILTSKSYEWEQSSKKDNYIEEYNKNKDIVDKYHEKLIGLSDKILQTDRDYTLWITYHATLRKIIEDNKLNRIIDSTGLKEVFCKDGKKINDMQHRIAEEYIKENLLNNYSFVVFKKEYIDYNTNISLKNKELANVESAWNMDKAAAETAKDAALKTITDYCINRYFNDKYTEVMGFKNGSNLPPAGNYDAQYRDFIKISSAGNTIYGFKDNSRATINYNQVNVQKNNEGEYKRYIRPDSNNFVRMIGDKSVLLLKDVNELAVYDITALNQMTLKSIKPVKDVFYILGSGKSYYYVTKDGELYEINSLRPAADKISAGDTVLITAQGEKDSIYILKKNGQITPVQGTKTELLIKPVNDAAIQTIKIKNNSFIF